MGNTIKTFFGVFLISIVSASLGAAGMFGLLTAAPPWLTEALSNKTANVEISPEKEYAKQSESKSHWKLHRTTSKIDDVIKLVVSVKNMNDSFDSNGNINRIHFGIACKSAVPYFYFKFNFYTSFKAFSPFTFRLEKAPANKIELKRSSDESALVGLREHNPKFVRQFIKDLYGKRSLVIQVATTSKEMVTTEFDITGLEDAIFPIATACDLEL